MITEAKAKRKWEVGQTLWQGNTQYVITKVGRKWLTVQHPNSTWQTEQVDAETLRVKSDFSQSHMHEDHDLYLVQQANAAAWRRLRSVVLDYYRCPENASAEGIHKAAAILGLDLGGDGK